MTAPDEHRRALILLCAALTAIVLSLGGCGLPDAFFLNPPVPGTSAGTLSDNFVIQQTDRSSEPEFRGYELYYKLYSDVNAIAADQNLGGTTGTIDALTQNGFLALCRGANVLAPAGPTAAVVAKDTSIEARTIPLIMIDTADRSSSFTITINMNPANAATSATNFTYTAPSGTYQQEIDRHVDGSILGVAQCKPFTYGQGFYGTNDLDIAKIPTGLQGNTLYIAVYAVSYGLQDLSTPIYSYPVYMGYLALSGSFSS